MYSGSGAGRAIKAHNFTNIEVGDLNVELLFNRHIIGTIYRDDSGRVRGEAGSWGEEMQGSKQEERERVGRQDVIGIVEE